MQTLLEGRHACQLQKSKVSRSERPTKTQRRSRHLDTRKQRSCAALLGGMALGFRDQPTGAPQPSCHRPASLPSATVWWNQSPSHRQGATLLRAPTVRRRTGVVPGGATPGRWPAGSLVPDHGLNGTRSPPPAAAPHRHKFKFRSAAPWRAGRPDRGERGAASRVPVRVLYITHRRHPHTSTPLYSSQSTWPTSR